MKKKILISAIAITLVSTMMFIPSVQSLTISALSAFRVGDAKTIKVTLADIEESMNYFKGFADKFKDQDFNDQDLQNYDAKEAIEHEKLQVKELSDISEFTAFSFNLPKDLKGETPSLYATDSQSNTIVVDTAKINDELSKIGVTNLLDNNYDGSEITVNVAPSIAAHYNDVDLFATQGVYLDGNDEVINGIWNSMLNMPFLSENLRSQLSNIDVKTRDVYLPVIMGLGREVSLGGVTGYIYSTQDMRQVVSMLPEGLTVKYGDDNEREGSALIWTKNGVLYCLVSDKSDSELAQIARSI